MGLCMDPQKEGTSDTHVALLEPEASFISYLWLLNWLLQHTPTTLGLYL